ncbi:hypothetical protein D3C73_816520 [compost metagenome]
MHRLQRILRDKPLEGALHIQDTFQFLLLSLTRNLDFAALAMNRFLPTSESSSIPIVQPVLGLNPCRLSSCNRGLLMDKPRGFLDGDDLNRILQVLGLLSDLISQRSNLLLGRNQRHRPQRMNGGLLSLLYA